MTEVLGIFSEGFASWRRALEAMEARLDLFANAEKLLEKRIE